MPAASLDGLVIDKTHALALDDITRRIELAAEDLAKGMLSSHNPKVEKPAPQKIVLSGGKGGSAFQARISISEKAVTVEVTGKLELSTMQMVFVGGEAGVRKRIRTEIEQALNDRIAAAEMGVDREKLLRKIGLSQKLFSRSQWKEAVAGAEQRADAVPTLLLELGFISKDQLRGLERAVDYRIGRDEDKSLAKVIVDSGYADGTTVEDALRQQKDLYGKTGELARICDLLMNGGRLSESQHLAARKIREISSLAKQADEETGGDEASGGPAPND